MKRRHLGILAAVWLSVVGTGMVLLGAYKAAPGVAAPSPKRWPAETSLAHDSTQPTLVVFLHPHCPCSRATLAELHELMANAPGQVKLQVAFIQPTGTPDDWVETDLWNSAVRIPGVTVSRDRDGVEAARFLVATSGETLLYSAAGELLYEGGITISRGHMGNNPGRASVLALLRGEAPAVKNGPVFGCPMFADDENPQEAPVWKK